MLIVDTVVEAAVDMLAIKLRNFFIKPFLQFYLLFDKFYLLLLQFLPSRMTKLPASILNQLQTRI